MARSALAGFFEGIALATWFKIAEEFVCPNSVESLQWPLGTVDAKMPRVPVHFTAKFHYSTALPPLWPFSTPELSNEQVGYGKKIVIEATVEAQPTAA